MINNQNVSYWLESPSVRDFQKTFSNNHCTYIWVDQKKVFIQVFSENTEILMNSLSHRAPSFYQGVIPGSECLLRVCSMGKTQNKYFLWVTDKTSLFYIIFLFLLPFFLINFVHLLKPSFTISSLKFSFSLISFSFDFDQNIDFHT